MTAVTKEENAILQSVLYSSVFEFPLTERDLETNLLECPLQGGSVRELYASSNFLTKLISFERGLFFPKGRSDWIDRRRRSEQRSLQQIRSHAFVLKLICTLPFTRMVALSGSAAHLNMDGQADIDLVIITRGRTVWSVALATLLLTKALRCRKQICFNYVFSDRALEIKRQDLFAANQAIHLKPLVGRKIFRNFLAANPFVFRFYPNFKLRDKYADKLPRCVPGSFLNSFKNLTETLLGPTIWPLIESLCRVTYRSYLRRHFNQWNSPEEVVLGADVLKLHTNSHRSRVLSEFKSLLSDIHGKAQDQ